MVTLKQFQAWIRKQREDYTFKEIGADFGASEAAVHRWLNGKRTPHSSVLKLAERVMQDQKLPRA